MKQWGDNGLRLCSALRLSIQSTMRGLSAVEARNKSRIGTFKVYDYLKLKLKPTRMKGFMYILQCSDDSYYTGSTTNLKLRIKQHQSGKGANHTKKRLPVKLVYFEEHQRIDYAFYREKQVQGWSRKKKESLIYGSKQELKSLAKCQNETHFENKERRLTEALLNSFIPNFED